MQKQQQQQQQICLWVLTNAADFVSSRQFLLNYCLLYNHYGTLGNAVAIMSYTCLG